MDFGLAAARQSGMTDYATASITLPTFAKISPI
jgi:hypothetical protein